MTNINKAILTVLKTSVGEVDKNKLSKTKDRALEDVQSAGFEVSTNSGMSEQGYVTIKNNQTGRSLVISKDFAGRSRIYGNGVKNLGSSSKAFNNVIKLIDFYGYLTKPMMSDKIPTTSRKMSQFKYLKSRENRYKRDITQAEALIRETQEALEVHKQQLEDTRAEINKLLNNKA